MNKNNKENANGVVKEKEFKKCKKIGWNSLPDPNPRHLATGEDEKLLYDYNIIKLLYNEVGTMFRHFLNWRRLLFGGYFAILYTLILALKWSVLNSNGKYISVIILLTGIIISIVFLLLEIRNRSLYRVASVTGSRIEQSLSVGDIGYYDIHNQLDVGSTCIRHSYVIGFLYVFCTVLMVGLLIAFWNEYIPLNNWISIPQEIESSPIQNHIYN